MVEFKLVIADPKTGKCVQKTISDKASKRLVGIKIGDVVQGEVLDLTGYEFVVTGGSDFCGFPMRKGISGARRSILAGKGVGLKNVSEGDKIRKTVCGEVIHDKIVQVNLKIMKYGKAELTGEAKKEGAKGAS